MNLPNYHYLLNEKYQLTQVVGQGGFGITYKGIWFTEVKGALGKVKTEVPVCIKEYFFKDYCYRDKNNFSVYVHSETGKLLFYKFKEKLIKEAKILSEVHHPHIVNVLEVFEENNTAYIAMEYIPGCSLKYMMDQEGFLPESKVLKYIHQIGTALQFVHEKNILHLDIKPSNILIDRNDTARLIDFGVSKRYDIQEQETSTTMLTLSKGFASIEQYDTEGTQVFSPCPDVYSLGATLYNLLAGIVPVESILRATRSLQKPSEINPAITPKTEAVILKAMEVVPANRYQTVAEMLAELDRPEWEENAVNPYLDSQFTENDSTLLITRDSSSQQEDEDATIIVKESVPVLQKRKSRKGVLITTLICVFVVAAASAMVILVNNAKEIPDRSSNMLADIVLPEQQYVMPEFKTEDTPKESSIINQSDSTLIDQEIVTEEEGNTEILPSEEKEKPELPSIPIEELPQDSSPQPEETPSVNKIDLEYSEKILSGNEKKANNDLYGALADYRAAEELKFTKEIVQLIHECEEMIETQSLSDRLAQYEEKLPLGKYKIVRKISSGRYGVIDENIKEYIPCKYMSVYKADEGRAFLREDNLFDIYNEKGILISEGVNSY